MEKCVNNKEDDKKEITSENEDEGVIHRDITEYKKETNQDTLDKVIEESPDDTSPIDMEECVNNKNDEKEITAENEYEGKIHRDITEYKR